MNAPVRNASPILLREDAGGIAILTLNRPEARNALNKAVRDGLRLGIEKFNDDDSAAHMMKSVVITRLPERISL